MSISVLFASILSLAFIQLLGFVIFARIFRSRSNDYYLGYLIVTTGIILNMWLFQKHYLNLKTYYLVQCSLGFIASYCYKCFHIAKINLDRYWPEMHRGLVVLLKFMPVFWFLTLTLDWIYWTHSMLVFLAVTNMTFTVWLALALNRRKKPSIDHVAFTVTSFLFHLTSTAWMVINTGNYDYRPDNDRFLIFVWLPMFFLEYQGRNIAAWIRQKRVSVQYEQMKLAEQKLHLQVLKTREHLLAYKLNPHTISNILNGIQHAVAFNDPKRAMGLIHSYSMFMNKLLSTNETAEHSLEDEAGLVEEYLNIARQQRGADLRATVTLEADPGVRIPVLITLPLVENAIIHGFQNKREQSLSISVLFRESEGDLVLEVFNSGPGLGRRAGNQARGYGIRNVQERLELLQARTGRSAAFKLEDSHDGVMIIGVRASIIIGRTTNDRILHED